MNDCFLFIAIMAAELSYSVSAFPAQLTVSPVANEFITAEERT